VGDGKIRVAGWKPEEQPRCIHRASQEYMAAWNDGPGAAAPGPRQRRACRLLVV